MILPTMMDSLFCFFCCFFFRGHVTRRKDSYKIIFRALTAECVDCIFCRGIRPLPAKNKKKKKKEKKNCIRWRVSISWALVNMKYTFTIPKTTLAKCARTCLGSVYGSIRSFLEISKMRLEFMKIYECIQRIIKKE